MQIISVLYYRTFN